MKGFLAAFRLLACVACFFSAQAATAYVNPARGIAGIGDPSVLYHNGTYYMYATTSVESIFNEIGIACWSSTDLVRWRPEGWAFLITPSNWIQHAIETPDVHYRNGKFLMVYSGRHTRDGLYQISLAESDSPLGPFSDIAGPFLQDTVHAYDPYIYEDDNGRNYLYYSTFRTGGYISLNARELSSDMRSFVAKPHQNVLAGPYLPWEIAPYAPIVEGAHILKRNGVYYLIYSGNTYLNRNYAVGYATGPSPVGPFTRYAGNPILASTANVSGPGTGHVIPSPDGTEMFYIYNAHTDAAKPGGDRSLYLDRISFTGDGILQIHGPTITCQPDASIGGPGSTSPTTCPEPYTGIPTDPITTDGLTGWYPLHIQQEGFAWSGRNAETGHIVAHVTPDPYLNRHTGVFTHPSSWMPYSEIGPDNYVRAKFSVYRAHQKDPNDPSQIPNLRLRCANRFAYANVLEVYHHLSADPGSSAVLHEMAPSADPSRPSVYTVDFDPLDVPILAQTPGEGVMRTFEAYALEPQENGDLVLAESSIATYPRDMLPDLATSEVLKKVYQPGATDAGDFRSVYSTDLQRLVKVVPIFEGFRQAIDNSGIPLPTYQEAGLNSTAPPPGVTFDTGDVPPTRVGIVTRDFFPGADRTADNYVRIQPGKQYKIRWHLTSTTPSNRNANIRLRTRTAKWGWNFKTEIGGAFAAGSINNTIAHQALPGIGCLNPDKMGNENGGWYTQLVNIPLDPAIRPEFPEGTPVEQRMPLFSSQPGPGVDAPSLKDLKFGMDLVDTLDIVNEYYLEQGNVTLDRIEVREYPRVE